MKRRGLTTLSLCSFNAFRYVNVTYSSIRLECDMKLEYRLRIWMKGVTEHFKMH
jgi:hypothetical protein